MKSRATRRRFLQTVAAGSAAALVAPVQALAQAVAAESATGGTRKAATPAPRKAAVTGRRVATPAEVDKLKGFTDDALKAIRAFPLPAGSPPAFAFRAMRKRGRAK